MVLKKDSCRPDHDCISTYDLLRTQIWYFISVAVSTMWRHVHLDKVGTFAGRSTRSTTCRRRESGQNISNFQLDTTSLTLFKQFDADCRSDEYFCTERQKTWNTMLCHILIQRFVLCNTGNLKRHEDSRIEDRVQCPKCLRYQRPGETFSSCGSYCRASPKRSRGRQRKESAVDLIMCVPDIHYLEKRKTQRMPPWKI